MTTLTPGRFGAFGGRYVPETLMPALDELERAFTAAIADDAFWTELHGLWRDFCGRPTPLYRCQRLEVSKRVRLYLKREDLLHTGAHKINNTVGQLLLAKRMGKKRIIAETGAGQHGVATAAACARFGLPCEIYMGAVDVERQQLNVQRMKLMGAKVIPVTSGGAVLKDALNEAMRDWVTNVESTHYVLGSVAGPHPFPTLVRTFHSVIGREAKAQFLQVEGKLPDAVVACVGGGSNAMGIFSAFIDDPGVALVAAEAAGHGLDSGHHGASLARGRPGVLHGAYSYLLQDVDGQVADTHSISAGLDYPGVGPELSALKDLGRLVLCPMRDDQALQSLVSLARQEGILCALETAHALAAAEQFGATLPQGSTVLVNLSGRGDKDLGTVDKALNAARLAQESV
jgi:tryptophan synthase beta chain